MYDLGPAFADTTVDHGTNVLVSGAPLSGVRRLAFESLIEGYEAGHGLLVISARYSAQRILEELETDIDVQRAHLAIVDCVARQQGHPPTEDSRIRRVNSPGHLTDIGIIVSSFIQDFRTRGFEQIRVVVDSLSMLLPYNDLESLFQFTHVLAERIDDVGGLGLYVLEAPAHDPEDRETLRQLFDATASVHDGALMTFEFHRADE